MKSVLCAAAAAIAVENCVICCNPVAAAEPIVVPVSSELGTMFRFAAVEAPLTVVTVGLLLLTAAPSVQFSAKVADVRPSSLTSGRLAATPPV